MLLTMSDVERGIYDNCRTLLERRQMCCHLQVVERLQKVIGGDMLTLNQVKDVMISHTNQVSLQQHLSHFSIVCIREQHPPSSDSSLLTRHK